MSVNNKALPNLSFLIIRKKSIKIGNNYLNCFVLLWTQMLHLLIESIDCNKSTYILVYYLNLLSL